MPWPKKQATAILLDAKRRGDTGLANKAKASLRGDGDGKGMGDGARKGAAERARQRRKV